MAKDNLFTSAAALMAVLCLITVAEGSVFKVGDSAGWTIMGNVNYSLWASTKTFAIGDTLLFTYNKNFHNVMEVSKADYKSCNAASPIATYTTGNDSITLKTGGDHYFLCGIPTHCSLGQKVEIKVGKSSSHAPSMAPAPAPTSGTDSGSSTGKPGTPALSPNANKAISASFSTGLGLGLVSIVASLFFL